MRSPSASRILANPSARVSAHPTRRPSSALLNRFLRLGSLPALALLFAAQLPSQQGRQVLSGHLPQAVASGQAKPLAALPADRPMHLAIQLPLRNYAELLSLLARLQDPSSPDYRHFLTVEQFTAAFGPTQSDYDAVAAFARANGFTVSEAPKNRLIVDIHGTVDQVNRAFHVTMTSYQHPTENRAFFSADRDPSLDLDVPVSHVDGLNNYSLPHNKLSRAPKGASAASKSGSGPSGTYLVGDMRAAYYGSGPLNGAGQSVGLYELDGYNMSDVTKTMDGVSYTVPINNVLVDSASAGSDGDDGEQVLDIVQAIGMAPSLDQVIVYIAPSTDATADISIFNRMVSDDAALQLSCSWGWDPDASSDDPIFLEMAGQGQTLFVATGDDGALTGNNVNDGYLWPADDQNVIAVGGTDLVTTGPLGAWSSETAWAYSNGGPSDNGILIPPWQVGVATPAADASTTLRNVPDIAAEGNYDNYLCDQGSCADDWGGTSYAAPRWAGFMALVNQQAASGGLTKGLGFIDPTLYTLAEGPDYDNDFHDIVSGNNDCCGQKTYWTAVTGYDLVTGWGSPNGQNMIDALAPLDSVTVSTSPANLSFTVDGTTYTGSHVFTWTVGSSHSLAVTSPQFPSTGTQDTFSGWSDGGVASHNIIVNAATSAFTAIFSTTYQLTTAAKPSAFGTVTPATGSYYGANSTVPLTATPGAGYFFAGWTGPVINPYAASTNVTMSAPQTVSAAFSTQRPAPAALLSPSPNAALPSSNVTFTWNPVPGALAYTLQLGATPGGNNLFSSRPTTATSTTPILLPTNGQLIYVRLTTWYSSAQEYRDYVLHSPITPCSGPPATPSGTGPHLGSNCSPQIP